MPRISNEQRLANLHADAMAAFDDIQSALRDERLQCLQDRRFYSLAGAQWEGPLGEQFENKPRFEINKIHHSVIRVVNEYRNNRITVDFISKDGSKDDKLADVCDGLYRADEQDSGAQEAYDNAFEEAVGGGFGAWRLRTSYEDEENDEDERQRIRIEPIYDADSSVFFDLGAKRQDKADAKFCFVIYSVPRKQYIEEWGDDPASWPKEVHQYEFDWLTPDVVFIAEYYKIEEVKETVNVYRLLDESEERYTDDELDDDDGKLRQMLESTGARLVRQKKTKKRKVRKYILSGGGVLEDCGHIAGKHIPIVPVYGKRWFVDNVERCMGHVRLAKDAQRLKNMQVSKLGEISALSSVEKPILLPEQVAGHQMMWAEDNLKNYPYLLVNPITGPDGSQQVTGPVAYTKSPDLPPAMAALLQLTEADMQQILGNQQGADKLVSNISGKAVEMIQQRLDMQTFIYMSNFSKGMRRCGEIWLSMAKDVYVEDGRKMKGIAESGDSYAVELMRPNIGKNGETVMENDLSSATFDVAVSVGPSSESRRAATVRALTAMMAITQDPEISQVLANMALMNMEGEGVDEARSFFRGRLLRAGVVKPTEEEAVMLEQERQAAAAQENANETFLKAASEEAVAKAAKARADTVLTVAKAEQTRAQTQETKVKTLEALANVDLDSRSRAAMMDQQNMASQQLQPATPLARPPFGPVR